MRRRLYFLLPDVETARQLEDHLLLARIEERHTHFLGKRGTDLRDLPEASVMQKTDLVHGLWTGLVAGGGTGATVGLVSSVFLDLVPWLGLGSILIFGAFGAGFGVWASSMIAISTPNSKLKSYANQIDQGHVLLIADVPKERVEEISEIVKKRFPGLEGGQVEPTIPAFP